MIFWRRANTGENFRVLFSWENTWTFEQEKAISRKLVKNFPGWSFGEHDSSKFLSGMCIRDSELTPINIFSPSWCPGVRGWKQLPNWLSELYWMKKKLQSPQIEFYNGKGLNWIRIDKVNRLVAKCLWVTEHMIFLEGQHFRYTSLPPLGISCFQGFQRYKKLYSAIRK